MAYTPIWTRVALVAPSGPAMVAGAAVRVRAATIRLDADTTTVS